MLRIVVNQFKLNALLLFMMFVVSNVAYLIIARLHGMIAYNSPGAIQVTIVTTSVMILGLFLREEQGKGQIIYRSLPLRHSTVVAAMYLLVIIVLLLNMAYGLSIQLINAHIGPWVPASLQYHALDRLFSQFDAGYAVEHSILARALAFTTVISVSIPLIIRYGSMWRILLGYLVVILLWDKGVDQLLRSSLNTGFFLGLSRWVAFATVLMMIGLGFSWRLSVWLYGRRDL